MSFLFQIDLITTSPDRQRKDMGDIASLAASMARRQLTPVILSEPDESGRRELIAGERRLTAAKQLKWQSILAIDFSELSPAEKTLIELEENIKRKALTWQEEVNAVAKYWEISGKSLDEVSLDLSINSSSVSSMCRVAEQMLVEPQLAKASSWSSAYEVIRIRTSKAASAALEDILADSDSLFPVVAAKAPEGPSVGGDTQAVPGSLSGGMGGLSVATLVAPAPDVAPTPPPMPFYSILSDFAVWAPGYTGKRFNLIHCDFPYGLEMDKAPLQNSHSRWQAEAEGKYDDSPELFDRLLRCLLQHQDKFVADSAHCIFWLAIRNYSWVAKRFEDYGWKVCETPLIWHKSDNAGIAPDVRRWPRRTYEMALFASRGDRKLVKLKAASFSGPTTKEHHLSEKPLDMLWHFFEMVVDEYTTILDPTCGSGTALAVAKGLGAKEGLGMDVLDSHVEYTNRRLK